METGPSNFVGLWVLGGAVLGLALLALCGAALAGWLPWPAVLVTWLLANALIPLLTLLRRPILTSPRQGATGVGD